MNETFLIPISKLEFKKLLKDCLSEVLAEQNPVDIKEDDERLMSVKQASEFLNLAKQTLYGYTSKNSIPYIKKGKKLYFNKQELVVWLTESSIKSKSQIDKIASDRINTS